MKACHFITILVALIFISCENNDDLVLDNQLELTYSYSPIPLGNIEAKFSENISYGPESRNTFDIFLPDSDRPTPLVIYIHGGGFISGNKEIVYEPMWSGSWDFPEEIRTLLKNDIAFATINYRLLEFKDDPDGVLKSLNDNKRSLQFIKNNSEAFNIDKNNIILTGSSAGAGTSLWLGFSDDMADLSNEDKVLRESTRVKAMAVKATQATYDLEKFQSLIFAEYNFEWMDYFELDPGMYHRFKSFYGMSSLSEFNTEEIRNYRRKVDMLLMMTDDDPEFWVANLQKPVVAPTQNTIVTHHAYHAKTLKTWADSIGIANVAYYGDYEHPTGESFIDFILRKALE